VTAPRANEHLIAIRRDSDCLGDRRRYVCLDRNERPSRWSPEIFREMLGELDPWEFTHYPDLGPLYERLISATGLPHERLCVGAGSDSLIRRAFQAFLKPGDRVLTPEPTYGMYAVWTRICQAEQIVIPYGLDLQLPLDEFVQTILEKKPRLVAIANPDQPTGSLLQRIDVVKIITACERVDALCIVDEAYFPFSPVTMLDAVREFSSLVVTRSFSKAGGIAGLRVGYAAADETVIRALHGMRSPGEVASVSATVAAFLLDRPDVMDGYRVEVEHGRKILIAAAEELGFACPRCYGNFQLLRSPVTIDCNSLVGAAARKGFLIKGAFAFPPLRDFVRITLDGSAVIEPFVECLREICRELRLA
jgi:histidinol-phosphate aminotransferase